MTIPQPKTGLKSGRTIGASPAQSESDLWEDELWAGDAWGDTAAAPLAVAQPAMDDAAKPQKLGACLHAILSEIGLCARIARDLDHTIGSTDNFSRCQDAQHLMTLQNLDLLCQLLEGLQCYTDGLTTVSETDTHVHTQEISLGHLARDVMLAAQRARLFDGTAAQSRAGFDPEE